MSLPSPIGHLGAPALDVSQARLIESASPMPVLVANVEPDGFTVLAVSSLLRRFVTGARHPAGPAPDEVIDVAGFGVLSSVLTAAVSDPTIQHVMELPVGDEPTWFELTVTPVVDGGSCHQVILVAHDRTADRDMEQRQRRSSYRTQAMLTHAPGLILLVDSTGRIIRASAAVEHLIGRPADELTGRAIFELMHPETLARAASVFNQILSQPSEPVTISDFRLNHAEGSPLWCEAVATNLLHDDDVAAIIINAYDVTERRLAEQRLELLATSDSLTGLANRRRLEQRLYEAFDAPDRVGVVGLVLVDLDDFKLVNDGLGHDIGDAVLRTIANRLERVIGPDGFVARIGGDEFAIVVEDLETPNGLDHLSEAVHATLRSPVSVREHDVYLRASIGTTTGDVDTADASALLRAADLALYRAKRNGRNQTVQFTAELQLEAEQRLATISTLQRAIREGRLRLAYQPVVDRDGRTIGAEALLRWQHDGELLNPARFLELAEDTGLILPMGTWVLEQASSDLAHLRNTTSNLEWVSINLSSRQLLDERLPLLVKRTLEARQIEPGSIAVEIAESTLHGDDGRAIAVLEQLAAMKLNIMLSLADLSTNQDVLAQLERLPINTIKLDRLFVQQLDIEPDGELRSLAAAILELAADHSIDVVAEGVETTGQAQVLRDVGCPYYQGFLYSEPLDLASFITRDTRS